MPLREVRLAMADVPENIDGAKVLLYSLIDSRHRFTGNCRHVVFGVEAGPVDGLAICRYDEGLDYYLFYCDAEWRTLTDTCHDTLDGAKDQAEFEYAGVSGTWEGTA